MSELSVRHAAALVIPECAETPDSASESARGSTSSTTVECLQSSGSVSGGSERQSVRKIEPRESEMRRSLLVKGCEETDVSGCANGITKAVGWGLSGTDPFELSLPVLGDMIRIDGSRSHTISILSSVLLLVCAYVCGCIYLRVKFSINLMRTECCDECSTYPKQSRRIWSCTDPCLRRMPCQLLFHDGH
jgi:hypothetical protein